MKQTLYTGALLFALSPHASAAIIDFEGLAAGTIVDDEYAPLLSVRADNLSTGPDVAVIFNSLAPTGGDRDLGGPFRSNNPALPGLHSAGNLLIIHENHTCDALRCDNPDDEGSRPAGVFYLDFLSEIRLESIDFFDIETAENGKSANNRIRLIDANDNELLPDSFYTPDTGGDNRWDRLLFGIDGVKRVELRMGGSGAIDNIAYSIIPLPPAAWLFGCGLLGLAALARSRR